MVKSKKLIVSSALFIAVIGALFTKVFAFAPPSVDCSVPSTKECTRVDVPGGTTVIHYGKAKPKPE